MELKFDFQYFDNPPKRQLLIEPYGIEIDKINNTREGFQTFNRTLWN